MISTAFFAAGIFLFVCLWLLVSYGRRPEEDEGQDPEAPAEGIPSVEAEDAEPAAPSAKKNRPPPRNVMRVGKKPRRPKRKN